jgi:hypothetical protein
MGALVASFTSEGADATRREQIRDRSIERI